MPLFLCCLIILMKKATHKFTLSSGIEIDVLYKQCLPRGNWQPRDPHSLVPLNSRIQRAPSALLPLPSVSLEKSPLVPVVAVAGVVVVSRYLDARCFVSEDQLGCALCC